ncbi:hypothetical protein Pelo_19563 [Pelomyxa schiedti]|nr:hypothetical protein Pelo_19563 [Pelomyxa schiedti]
MFEDNFGLAVSRRWVVCIRATAYSPMFQYSYAIKVWRVGESGCLEGGREPAAVLDLGDAAVLLPDSQPNSNLKEIKVKLAWTHCCSEGGCIEDGDELCIVADRNCKCCFNIVDIRKCLESQRITVIKRFCISRDPAWRDVESYRYCHWMMTTLLEELRKMEHLQEPECSAIAQTHW